MFILTEEDEKMNGLFGKTGNDIPSYRRSQLFVYFFVSCHIQLTRVLTCTAYLGEEEAIIEFLESKTLHSSYYTSTTTSQKRILFFRVQEDNLK